ncbi:MAG: hypothetical protein BM563_00960 [Bacteroidetes bacterium MedPE-SWsnd-G1]|nr:MAG: hypothetical protein BM563_00960 [Bacteroidetes bacterium MedPE-SWsnd-G1]
MKKSIYLFIAGLFLISFSVQAQKFEITPQYGYQVGAKYHYYGGYVKMTDSDQYGITLNMEISPDVEAEFFWAQQNASIRTEDYQYFPIEVHITDIQANHFQLGAIHSFGYGDAKPFAGASLGWTSFNPDDSSYSSNTKFTIGISGGLRYYFSKRLGFRLQGQLLMPIQWGSIYIGPGGGAVSTGGSLLQLNFTGGLIFGLGK